MTYITYLTPGDFFFSRYNTPVWPWPVIRASLLEVPPRPSSKCCQQHLDEGRDEDDQRARL